MNLKFCLADFVYLIQKPSRGHYNCFIFIAQMYAVTPQLLNQINKICHTELRIYPSGFRAMDLPYWFQGNFAASSVLNFCLREFLLSAFANCFELRCEPKATDAIVLQNLPLL